MTELWRFLDLQRAKEAENPPEVGKPVTIMFIQGNLVGVGDSKSIRSALAAERGAQNKARALFHIFLEWSDSGVGRWEFASFLNYHEIRNPLDGTEWSRRSVSDFFEHMRTEAIARWENADLSHYLLVVEMVIDLRKNQVPRNQILETLNDWKVPRKGTREKWNSDDIEHIKDSLQLGQWSKRPVELFYSWRVQDINWKSERRLVRDLLESGTDPATTLIMRWRYFGLAFHTIADLLNEFEVPNSEGEAVTWAGGTVASIMRKVQRQYVLDLLKAPPRLANTVILQMDRYCFDTRRIAGILTLFEYRQGRSSMWTEYDVVRILVDQ